MQNILQIINPRGLAYFKVIRTAVNMISDLHISLPLINIFSIYVLGRATNVIEQSFHFAHGSICVQSLKETCKDVEKGS